MNGIPVLHVEGDCIARAWEDSLIELYRNGCNIQTQYDKPDDPPSKDATMIVTVHDPLAEPMIHRDFPGGFEELQEYVMEVCEGIKDHFVRDRRDPDDTRWEYTYHQRLFAYEVPARGSVDQIETLCRKLAEAPHTRRAQAITWKVWEDNDCYDPACLQSVWCRILEAEDGPVLNMNVRFRSNDAYKAAFMNMFALVPAAAEDRRARRGAVGQADRAGPLLPHGRQLSHLRLEFPRIRGPLPGGAHEAHLRAAHDALRGRARDHGGSPAGDSGQSRENGALASPVCQCGPVPHFRHGR